MTGIILKAKNKSIKEGSFIQSWNKLLLIHSFTQRRQLPCKVPAWPSGAITSLMLCSRTLVWAGGAGEFVPVITKWTTLTLSMPIFTPWSQLRHMWNTFLRFIHSIFNTWWNHCVTPNASNNSWVYLSSNFLERGRRPWDHCNRWASHPLAARRVIYNVFESTNSHKNTTPEKAKKYGAKQQERIKKNLAPSQRCHTVDERYRLCAESRVWSIVSKINWERRKQLSLDLSESQADSPPSVCSFLTMIGVEFLI